VLLLLEIHGINMATILLVFNPISGAGRSSTAAAALEPSLTDAGHDVTMLSSSLEPTVQWLDPILQEHDMVLAIGGDGTVRMVAEGACRTNTPIYQVPMGTENLFARAMGMTNDHQAILAAINVERVCRLDMAHANGEPCLLMASCGFDAAVVHDLASRRRGPISHWSYLPCIIRQWLRWRPISIRVMVDEACLHEEYVGLCFVCNSREYGGQFNPAPEASMDDGVLDVVLLPTRSRFGLLRWMLKARRGRQFNDARAVHAQGRTVQLEFATPMHWQIDGDCPRESSLPVATGLKVVLEPASLPVLLPA
jgi:diacylglycerol kinase (ATP)